MTFNEVDIRHEKTLFVNVVLRKLNLHFQCRTFSCYAFAKNNCIGSGSPRQICLDLYGL